MSMALPKFNPEYRSSAEFSYKDELVWRAAEVLRTYASADDAELFDNNMDFPELEIIDEEDKNYDELIISPELDLSVSTDRQRTKWLDISIGVSVSLDNTPLLVDNYGRLQQLTEPGYVALMVLNDDDIDTVMCERNLDGIGPATTQIIFRLPWHDEGAAVFQGFSLNEEDRVDYETEAIKKLENLLEDIVDMLRQDIHKEVADGNADYIILTLPTTIAQHAIEGFMSDLEEND